MGKRMEMKGNRKFPIITKKIVGGVIVSGIVLCSAIFAAGFWAFSHQSRRQYDDNIRSIAEAARECLNPDAFPRYIGGEKDAEFEAVNAILQDFVDKFDLNLLYVSVVNPPDYTHITYIYNPVKRGGRWTEFPLGYEEDYIESDYNNSARRVFEGGETIVRHTLRTRSGSHITAMLPVEDSSGRTVAVIGVQKNIQGLADAQEFFINFVVAMEVACAVLFGLLFSWYFNAKIIRPLLLITRETDHFANHGGRPSDKLLEIRSGDEIGALARSVHQMEHDVCRNIDELTKMTAEKERIGTELRVAAKIQADMLPKGYPPFPARSDFDLFATMAPAKEVGGDLYDYLLLDDDHLMMAVGDVSGKGVPAALFMGKCKVLLDFCALLRLPPAEIFRRANEKLCEGNDSALFVTCWLGILTFSTGELRYVNAGHPHPILTHGGSSEFMGGKPNIVMGAMDGMKYDERTVTLEKGDRLLIYTDGVTEATDSSLAMFGEERLLAAVRAAEPKDAPDAVASIRAEIDSFAGEAEQFDDITMLQFIWKG